MSEIETPKQRQSRTEVAKSIFLIEKLLPKETVDEEGDDGWRISNTCASFELLPTSIKAEQRRMTIGLRTKRRLDGIQGCGLMRIETCACGMVF